MVYFLSVLFSGALEYLVPVWVENMRMQETTQTTTQTMQQTQTTQTTQTTTNLLHLTIVWLFPNQPHRQTLPPVHDE